jgi:2-amino-4-hydroxy-6-hydroxymethyldihydropteridine diphosphokinase
VTADPALASDRFARRTAALRGFRQSYVREGQGGEPVVLLHGWHETSRIWWRNIAPLADAGFDVVAPDLRGFGESGLAPDDYRDVAPHSADLYALLRRELGFERVTLVGGDLGGAIAQDFALRFPGFAQRLVLLNPSLRSGVIPTETLILVGCADPAIGPDFDAIAALVFPNRVGPFRVARAGHCLQWEVAAVLNGAIRHLCRGQPPRAGEHTAYVGLGSNLGDRERHLCAGFAALRLLRGVGRVDASLVYETDPVGPGEQGPYLNAVARLRTRLSPRALLEQLLAIERIEGRERSDVRNAPRTLDLDLLLYGECVLAEPDLVVPHLRLAERPFVLEPLCDLAPDLVPPGGTAPVSALAAAVRDPAAVRVRET